MPAVKCLPVEDSTMARASAPASRAFTISGSSSQNSFVMLLKASGRDRRTWAILSSIDTSKQV
jgi:hypothetical protein